MLAWSLAKSIAPAPPILLAGFRPDVSKTFLYLVYYDGCIEFDGCRIGIF